MPADQHSLLVIEDESYARRDIVNYLEKEGYKVYQAVESVEGLSLYDQHQPHVVLCDLKTLNNSHDEVLNRLQLLVNKTPLIVTSATEDINGVVEALRFGASDYLLKPIADMTMLGHAVSRSLDYGLLQQENNSYKQQLEQTNLELKNSLALLEHDQKAGRQVQFNMLPPSPKIVADYQLSHRIFPSLFLSGDFVDYFRVGNEYIVFFIADVSGHGASSAFVTVLLKNLFSQKRSDFSRKSDRAILSPLAMLKLANELIFDIQVGKHLTMCVGALHMPTGELLYSNAGHLPQPILVTNGNSQFLKAEGMPVGLFDEPEFNEEAIILPESFVLTLFSDGILEILAAEGLLAQEAFLLERLKGSQLSVEALTESLELQQIVEFPDDIAVLLISRGLM